MNRRSVLKVVGGGVILAAGAAGGGIATGYFESVPASTTAPWREAGKPSDVRRAALSYAILAPNPHNRQPWLVDLGTDGSVTLFADTERLLPETDPHGRQILIGLGCFIETFVIAAQELGQATDVALFPDGVFDATALDARPVARLTLRPSGAKDPLFAAILKRRSVKEPFDMTRPVREQDRAAIAASVAGSGVALAYAKDGPELDAVRALLWEGMRIETHTPAKWMETVNLIRIGNAEVAASPDGVDLGGPLFNTLKLVGAMERATLADTNHMNFKQGLEQYEPMARQTPVALWLTTATNTRHDQVASGRAWMRVALTVTSLGLALHPMSQVLQEFDEMADAKARMEAIAGVRAPAAVQMLARLGYGPQVGPSPRWPLSAKIRSSSTA